MVRWRGRLRSNDKNFGQTVRNSGPGKIERVTASTKWRCWRRARRILGRVAWSCVPWGRLWHGVVISQFNLLAWTRRIAQQLRMEEKMKKRVILSILLSVLLVAPPIIAKKHGG